MARVFIFLLDSFGIGGAPDAAKFSDEGANTFGHIADHCAGGAADRENFRKGPLNIPNLVELGLLHAAHMATGTTPVGMDKNMAPVGMYGCASEISNGKDTPSGHWEMMGVPVLFDWGYFGQGDNAFPEDLLSSICQKAGLTGTLANCHASGMKIIKEFGLEHIRTGQPICYTSADSVFQIAAHEEHFGLDALYELCETVRKLIDPLNIARVIARPFTGETPQKFSRTGNRRDYSVKPPKATLLKRLDDAGKHVIGVGKISDIFAHDGVNTSYKANGNSAIFDAALRTFDTLKEGGLAFANFVDFDMVYGHQRDVAGYAKALEDFDKRLPEVARKMRPSDMVIITADHGCDPTWRGNDHTRERIPVLAFGGKIKSRSIGIRESFSDIGATAADFLGMEADEHGVSFL